MSSATDPSISVGPHEFDRLSIWRHRKCRACYIVRDYHPVTWWTPARPLGDTGHGPPPGVGESKDPK